MTSTTDQPLIEKIALINPAILSAAYFLHALAMPFIFYYEVKYPIVEAVKVLFFVAILAMFFIWPIAAFWFAKKNVSSRSDLNTVIVNFVSIIAFIFVLAFFPWLINTSYTERLMERPVIENAFALISTLGGLAIPALIWLTSSQIVYTEKEKGIVAPGIIITIIQILYIPIGIWWLHKRFLKIQQT